MTDNYPGSLRGAFVIVVRDVLVGQDLAQTIAEDRPEAPVIVATSLQGALVAMHEVATVEAAFVAADPKEFARSPLAFALAECGAQVVLMGLWADEPLPVTGWKRLRYPFTSDDVRGVISNQ